MTRIRPNRSPRHPLSRELSELCLAHGAAQSRFVRPDTRYHGLRVRSGMAWQPYTRSRKRFHTNQAASDGRCAPR